MARLWRIYTAFVRSSLVRELEFKANFFANIVQNFVWITFTILIVLVIYGNTDSVAGWNRGNAFVLAGTVMILAAINNTLFFGLMELPEQIRKGTLDFVVTKPVDAQIWVSLRKFNFSELGPLVASIAIVLFGVSSGGSHPGVAAVLGYIAIVAMASILLYCFRLVLMASSVWFIRVDNIWVLEETTLQVARNPIEIFSPGVQHGFTYILPLALLASIPSLQLVRGFEMRDVVLGLTWTLLAVTLSRLFWNRAMLSYTSASS